MFHYTAERRPREASGVCQSRDNSSARHSLVRRGEIDPARRTEATRSEKTTQTTLQRTRLTTMITRMRHCGRVWLSIRNGSVTVIRKFWGLFSNVLKPCVCKKTTVFLSHLSITNLNSTDTLGCSHIDLQSICILKGSI